MRQTWAFLVFRIRGGRDGGIEKSRIRNGKRGAMTSYCQLIEKNNDILVISFSHMGVPAGSFAHPNALKTFPYSLLQLNCPNNSFYLSAIPGVAQDVEGIASALKGRIAEIGARKVVCYGASMGAFGAVLYGFLLEVDLIIALGPEISLGLKGAPARGVVRDPSVFAHPLSKNLLKVAKAGKTRLVALFGEKAIADIFGALDLNDRLPDTCYSLKNAYHSVASFIEGVYGLNRFLLETVEAAVPAALMAEHRGDFIQHRRLVESLYALAYDGKRNSGYLEVLESLPPCASPETKSYAYLAAAQHFLAAGDSREGRYALRKAFSLNADDLDLATLYFGYDHEEFMSLDTPKNYLFDLLNRHRLNKSTTYYRLAALMLRHQWPSAIRVEEQLAPFLAHDKHWAEVAFHLAQILEADGDLQAAEEQLHRALDLSPNNSAYSQFKASIRERRRENTGAGLKDLIANKAISHAPLMA
jgi:tetratricopeptide (TPR) repeat protein